MTESIAEWWNGVEVWIAQLWFPWQFGLMLAALLPLVIAVTWLIDRAAGCGYRLWRRAVRAATDARRHGRRAGHR
ncbi:hypothetical protein [Haloechinothrix sp. LS1_15]|uniref:hypothetical protein n=1 Tax=Haloechinothrix sp. LS1_15 TaxID=2652248 RepID=UPI002947900A|nr:hypothetical protein [Haloechinothrix sp. LS1_15]MDV6012069.1 hypothetical protein [Haloechinothrix sp. LS1_15]